MCGTFPVFLIDRVPSAVAATQDGSYEKSATSTLVVLTGLSQTGSFELEQAARLPSVRATARPMISVRIVVGTSQGRERPTAYRRPSPA